MSKQSVAGGLLLLAGLTVAVAGDRQPVYRTPQEVFEAAKKALQKEDMKGFCATLTDDSRDAFAGVMVLMPMMVKGFAKFAPEDKQKELLAKLKPLEDVMTKHGLTEEALNKMKGEKPAGKGPEAMKQALKQLVAPVKDRCAFIAEMVAAFKKVDGKAKEGPIDIKGELKDVMIDGDKAKGVIVGTKDGKEKRDPIEFRKIAGSWKIDLPMDMGKGMKLGAPPGR
jgi:hypothetical protein